jgi:uncharacterized membrane protein
VKLEIAHDSLAKHIYEKASAEDKLRKKIADFISTRYNFYLDNNKSLLKSDDLHYIEPHLDDIELGEKEAAFVRKSQQLEKRRQRSVIAGTIALVLLLSALTGWALWSRQLAKNHEYDLTLAQKDLMDKQRENHNLIHELKAKNDQLEEKDKENQRLADSLAAKSGLTVNIDSLSDDQKKAMIITLVGNRKTLEAEKEELQEMYESIIKREVNKIEKEKEKEKAKEIQKAKDEEAKRIKNLLEQKHRQLMQQKELELRNAKSVALSAKALAAFEANELKTAFQLASEAYELDKSNKEAIEVLQKIAKKKSDVFDKKYGPNMKDPEQIIKRFKKTYGQQSSSIIQRKYFQQKR